MKKKLLIVTILAVVMLLCVSLAACDKGTNTNKPSITIEPETLSLTVGASKRLSATVKNAVAEATFSSSNTAIVTVGQKSGVVTGVSDGSATITASITVDDNTYSATCQVTVGKPTPTITLNSTQLDLLACQDAELAATTQNDEGAVVVYSSADANVAKVDAETGVVTGLNTGTTTITATITVDDHDYSTTCTVNVTRTATRDIGDFIKGMDMSTVIALEQANVRFKDSDGQVTDVFKILADYGVTTIRVRIWNDPYDSDDKGYGGGNCDVDKAIAIGKRATMYGMDLLVDFHYSDFWADPLKQTAPKAWQSYNVSQKEEAIYNFTKETLDRMKAEGVSVGMVQVGNETTNGLCGETNWTNICKLMNAGSRAVREVYSNALVALHFTNPEKGRFPTTAQTLATNNVDYDVFGTSYYPCYHGTLANLQSTLDTVATTYNKYVMVLETQYPYTQANYDETPNTLYNKSDETNEKYDYSVQGQYNMVKDIFDTIAAIDKGLGVCYWEGACIAVSGDSTSQYFKYHQYGCGWATSYASEYDSNAPTTGLEGSVIDNQAFFDNNGKVLSSLGVFKLEYRALENVKPNTDSGNQGGSEDEEPVGDPVKPTGEVLVNGGFESDSNQTNPSNWTVDNTTGITQLWVVAKDAKTGNNAFACWYASEYQFTLSQEVKNMYAGSYTFTISVQGTNSSSSSYQLYAYVSVNGGTAQKEAITIGAGGTWTTVSVTFAVAKGDSVEVGIMADLGAGIWLSIDDASLTYNE